jgi:hypothetical protein
MVPADNLLGESGFELAEGQRCVLVWILGAATFGRTTGRARKTLELAHLRADQSLDVAAVVLTLEVYEFDSVLPAPAT